MHYCTDENLEQVESSGSCDSPVQQSFTVHATGSYVIPSDSMLCLV